MCTDLLGDVAEGVGGRGLSVDGAAVWKLEPGPLITKGICITR
jgi:hypothetical protein